MIGLLATFVCLHLMQFEVMERYMTLAQSLALALALSLAQSLALALAQSLALSLALALALALALEQVMNRYLALVKPCVGAVHSVECQSPLLS